MLLTQLIFCSQFFLLDGNGGGDGMTGYSFDPETGEFKEAYDVDTGKTIPGAAFVSEYSPSGEFVGGYSLPGTPGSKETSTSKTPSSALGGQEIKSLGGGAVGVEGTKKETPISPVITPEVIPGGESKVAPKTKKRQRRPTILTENMGLMYSTPGNRRSLLGG